jgi:beta-glucosidase
VIHGLCKNERDAAHATLVAGLDMEMATKNYLNHLESLILEDGSLVRYIDDAVRRVLGVKHKLGLFDQPYVAEKSTSVAVCPEHLELAKKAVHDSVVLLKNEGEHLPLSGFESKGGAAKKIALIGPLADDAKNQLGCWAFDGTVERAVTLRSALEARIGQDRVAYAPGVVDCRSRDTSGFEAATLAVSGADVAVVVLGEDANISGESKCRAFLDLPGAQHALLERLAKTGTPIVLIIMAGRPLVIGSACELAQAVLFAWHPGTQAGPGLVELLLGDVSPSGRLPTTFPRTVGQIPIYYAAKNTGRPAPTEFQGIPEGTPLDPKGFASSYLDVEVSPLFPFGFGLSYTTFGYDALEVTPRQAKVGAPVEVSVRVTNTGKRAAEEVVQLYVRDLVASVTRPVRQLKGISRVHLAPGESREVRFTLTARELEFVGRDMKYVVEPGTFQIFVGGSSGASLSSEFELV